MKKLTINKLKSGQKIIIYGAGVYGEITFAGLNFLGLVPFCFCDREKSIGDFHGIKVIQPNMIDVYKDAIILIAIETEYWNVKEFLDNKELENYDISTFFDLPLDINSLSYKAQEKYQNKDLYLAAVKYSRNPEIINISHMDLLVTEKCTLRCRDCSALIPYYVKPQNYVCEEIICKFNHMLQYINHISELRILGGEPFINDCIYKLFEEYRKNKKISNLVVYTNGTVIPDKKVLTSMNENNVIVHISDYDINTNKISQLTKVLNNYGIKCRVRKFDTWQDMGAVSCRNHSENILRSLYEECYQKNCYTFLKGKLYNCPRQAHLVNLGIIENDYNSVDFNDEYCNVEEKRKELLKMIYEWEYITACNYCSGMNFHKNCVKAAIQIK